MRSVTRSAVVVLSLALSACGTDSSPTPASPPSEANAAPLVLPGGGALLPAGVESATGWREMSSHPSSFDPETAFDTPEALADAFGAAIHADYAGGPMRPDLDLVALFEEPDRVGYVISETGIGDDSVAGTQYALILVRGADGWRIDDLQTRALCRRGGDDELCT